MATHPNVICRANSPPNMAHFVLLIESIRHLAFDADTSTNRKDKGKGWLAPVRKHQGKRYGGVIRGNWEPTGRKVCLVNVLVDQYLTSYLTNTRLSRRCNRSVKYSLHSGHAAEMIIIALGLQEFSNLF